MSTDDVTMRVDTRDCVQRHRAIVLEQDGTDRSGGTEPSITVHIVLDTDDDGRWRGPRVMVRAGALGLGGSTITCSRTTWERIRAMVEQGLAAFGDEFGHLQSGER